MADVEMRQVQKVYPGGIRGLDEVSLSVAAGELFVLLGPSGSGKSTLLRLLAGLEDLSSGSIWVGGKRIDALPPHRRGLSYLGQRPALYPHRSVRDNLVLGLKGPPGGLGGGLAPVVEMLGLEGLLDRRPWQLSGGQLQRVALGRVLLRPGPVYLLDEALTNLDGPLRWDLRRILHLLQRRQRATMFFVTHDQDEALSLADRLAVLDRGRVVQVGTPVEVFSRPATDFVARHLGWPPMTLLRGHLTGGQECDGGAPYLNVNADRLAAPREWQAFGGRDVLVGSRSSPVGPGGAGSAGRVLPGSFLFDALTGRLLHAPAGAESEPGFRS